MPSKFHLYPLSVRSPHSETQAELPRHLIVIVSAFITGVDASGRTACKTEQRGLGILSGFLLRLNARRPQPNASRTGNTLGRLRERRTVGRAGHFLAAWALFNKPAVVGWPLCRVPDDLDILKQAKRPSIMYSTHARPTFNNGDKLQGRQASGSSVSMCNVETRESATLMSCQHRGQ